MGYSLAQRESLKATIERADADIVIVGTPIDLRKVLNLTRTPVRASYDYAEMDNPGLIDEVRLFLAKQGL